MPITGADLARAALRAIGALDPTEAGEAEDLADVLAIGTRLVDAWRTDDLTISGTTRSVYPLTANTQSYTIGDGGTFNQQYPADIMRWGVIPDDTATHPDEKPMGRPLTMLEWGAIRIKSQTAGFPTRLAWDERYAAGFGRILVHPIPNNNNVSVVLYQKVPAIVSLVSATTYTLQPGAEQALVTNLAREVALTGGFEVPEMTLAKVTARADYWLGKLRRKNYRPTTAPLNPGFATVGSRHRKTFNVRTDA